VQARSRLTSSRSVRRRHLFGFFSLTVYLGLIRSQFWCDKMSHCLLSAFALTV
jgi:hypothetical protein